MCVSVEMLSKFCAAKCSSEIFFPFTLKTRGDPPPPWFDCSEFPVYIGDTLHATQLPLGFIFAQTAYRK